MFVFPKRQYKIREEEFYEEKSIICGIGSNYATVNNGIGS